MTIPTRHFSPVSCDDLRALFSKEVPDPKECGVERLGALRGHLSLCAKCQAIYGARLEELVQQAFLPKIIRGLGMTMSMETQQELLTRLQDSDLCIRMAAVEALGTLGTAMPVAVQEALVARLADTNWTARMGAAETLGKLGPVMAISVQEALVVRLADPDKDVREGAVEALGELGAAMPVFVQQALVARLEDPEWTVRMGAVQALSQLGTTMSAAVREALEARLVDPDQEVRQVAEEALSLVGPPVARVEKPSIQVLSDVLQRLVAATRDLFWPPYAHTPILAFPTMSHRQSHHVVLEEEDAQGIMLPSSLELKEAEHVNSWPLLTGSGRFHMALHGPESRLVGKDLCCDLQLNEGQTLSLRTPIRAASDGKGWEAIFDEPILTDPSLHAAADHQIPFDRHYLRLVVRAAQA